MFSIIIVEDEENIRVALGKYFPWAELGYKVIMSFDNGQEAIEFIKENPCDVVLTDIRMEKMDGLKMIEEMRRICPDIKVVVMSGYDRFDYAQQAIRLNVSDYLLKPVDDLQMTEVFQKLKGEISGSTRKRESQTCNN